LTQSGRRDGAAIASAIDDAIGILGAVMELSLTPAQTVFKSSTDY